MLRLKRRLPLLGFFGGALGDSVLFQSEAYESGALGPSPIQTFISSNLTPVEWNVLVAPPTDKDFEDEGYVFFSPSGPSVSQVATTMFDIHGHLVWDSTSEYGAASGNFAVQRYRGKDYITIWLGLPLAGCNQALGCRSASGYNLLLDKNYKVAANVTVTGLYNDTLADFHEFNITPNGTALMTAFPPGPLDLSAYNVSHGWVVDCVAQEVDIETGKAIFTWHASKHVNPSECYTTVNTTSGAGTENSPWDYFHMNSIDKDSLGNYLISSRHCKTVYYVAPSGDIIWRLGGKNNSFTMGNGTSFAFQHNPRWRSSHTISLFDNDAAGWEIDAPYSRGLLLDLDFNKMHVELIQDFAPANKTPTESQGSFQKLGNGHWFAGWGQNAYLSEYDSDGTLIWATQFGISSLVQSYRGMRYTWKGYPLNKPSFVITRSNTSSTSSLRGFVSWNGATEVRKWQLSGSDNANSTSGHPLFEFVRSGFETNFSINGTSASGYKFYRVSGLDVEGRVLGRSNFVAS